MALRRISWVVAIVVCLAPQVARADALEEAKRIAKQANIHYQLGRFAEASDAYTKSYELVPTAGLLFNLGQCQLALTNYERAIFFFEGYLREKPDSPNAALVRDLVAEAHKALAAQQASRAAAEEARQAALHHVEPPPPPPPPPPRDRRRVPAVALGATSMALVAVSVYLGTRSDDAGTASRLAGAGTPTRASFDSDRSFAIAAGATGGLALASAISSGVLGYLGWARPRHAQVAIAPASGGGIAAVAGAF